VEARAAALERELVGLLVEAAEAERATTGGGTAGGRPDAAAGVPGTGEHDPHPSPPASAATHTPLDSRARTHIQTAALAAATVAVLRPLVRDDDAVSAALASHLGGAAAPAAASLLAAVAGLSPDPYPAASRRLAALRSDWGGAAPRARLEGGPAAAVTTLTLPAPCLYAAALEAVGAGGGEGPFLAVACCSADAAWLGAGLGKGSEGDKVVFRRAAWVGAGEPACVLEVSRGEGGWGLR